LPSGHPEVAHEEVRHLRGHPITQSRISAELCVEHAIDLLTPQTFRRENIHESNEADLGAGPINYRGDMRADRTGPPEYSSWLITVDTSHMRLARIRDDRL
jgi:hypothetical protein